MEVDFLASGGGRHRGERAGRWAASVVATGVVFLTAGCWGAPERPSIVLIVVDTLRADHMSLYGYERRTTPGLDRLAANAAVLEHAYSPANWTLPGVASILTGQWPAIHGARLGPDGSPSRLREEVPTLAEVLGGAGYSTGAIVNGGYVEVEFGFARGFDHYDFSPSHDEEIRRADVSVDRALAWIDEQGARPFFLLLHLFDVHHFYDAPEPARGTFTDAYADRIEAPLDSLESRREAERKGDLEFHMAAYDEEILWVDMQVSRFVGGLQERGLWGPSLVALTADHGEAFREHGYIAHGYNLHNEIMRVPLVLWGPGVVAYRYPEPASTVDLVPTLLDLVHVEDPPDVSGVSLLPLFRGEDLAARVIYAQSRMYQSDLAVAIRWPLKMIQDFQHVQTEMYDLSVDPGETNNLAVDPDEDMLRVIRQLRRQARDLRDGRLGDTVDLSPALREQLRSLGYIQ